MIADSEKPRLWRKRTWRAFSLSFAGGVPKRRRHSATMASMIVDLDTGERIGRGRPFDAARLQARADGPLAVAAALLPDHSLGEPRVGQVAKRGKFVEHGVDLGEVDVASASITGELRAQFRPRIFAACEQARSRAPSAISAAGERRGARPPSA